MAVESTNIARDQAIYREYIDAAEQGDAEAQFLVGNSLCCTGSERTVFYSTRKALNWLCSAARQGHAPAMFRVGKILSGDLNDELRPLRRVGQTVGRVVSGADENLPLAYGWLQLASVNGETDAADRAQDVYLDMSPEQQLAADTIVALGEPAACTLEEAGLG